MLTPPQGSMATYWTVLLTLSILSAVAGPCLAAITWSSCSPSGAPVQITSVTISSGKGGSPTVFTFAGTSKSVINSGQLNVKLTYNLGFLKNLPVPIPTTNLCSITKCPSGPGQVSGSFKYSFPQILSKVKFNVKVTGTSGSTTLFCIQGTFSLT
eukprot:TRINITY_DN17081_c0_g1_i1.p1 TRINITY_DN17081_c0_g1~~TRINITY_DN17081_c0_g1_i1.p1  ORF type:complete len:155 (-),score=34.95 TRINITY_DN17081_c0_g1_i1:162-626(-)